MTSVISPMTGEVLYPNAVLFYKYDQDIINRFKKHNKNFDIYICSCIEDVIAIPSDYMFINFKELTDEELKIINNYY